LNNFAKVKESLHNLMKIRMFLTLFLSISLLHGQELKKSVNAKRIDTAPKIDGLLEDPAWQGVEEATDFVMYQPGSGDLERQEQRTVAKVIYDDEAIYFGVMLYDDKPDEIMMQFTDRDQIGQTDYFQVNINPNNDGQNDTEFIVMSSGVQADAKANSGRRSRGWGFKDFSWSAVWYSAVKHTDDGWSLEMKIPYAALRFSNTEVQTWGINFRRSLKRINEEYSWNFIDKTRGDYTQYAGNLSGLKNIEPPVRLSFFPYASTSWTHYDGESEFEHSAGMDLKYGISESFTLDATLIPDFGQTAFDDIVLNLGPFEQRYSEKRQFFTEGTELFDKGSLFYSRRIGNQPVGYDDVYDDLADDEEVIENPDKVNMLNAIKVSGRTKGGLGIGVFNAITERTSARIKNLTTQEIRTMVTEPVTNYNLFVIDQQFNQNSSISLVNSNVLRSGHFRDANATALNFDLSDKGNKYNVSGNIKMSNVYEDEDRKSGYSGYFSVGKTHGNIQYSFTHYRANDTYDINDMGFQRRNNYANYSARVSYRIFEPTEKFNNIRISLEGNLRYQNEPYELSSRQIELDAFLVKTNRFAFGSDLEFNIGDVYDFYEPRVDGRYFRQHGVFQAGGWFSTDFRKRFAIDVRSNYAFRYGEPNTYIDFEISPRFRFTDKFEIVHQFEYSKQWNEKGYVTVLDDDSIIFGNRDNKTVTNSIAGKLSFNTKSSLALTFRHYWSPVNYDDNYFELNDNGLLDPSTYSEINDINYNIWNLDLSFAWEFAPGSQLVALYRNSIFNSDEQSDLSFGDNLKNLFDESMLNNFSLKFIYYLDYNKLKAWL
jgi:hypothetical protein